MTKEEITDAKTAYEKALAEYVEQLTEEINQYQNIIQKKELEICSLKQTHEYDVNMIDDVKGEAVKLYDTIDLMAEYIAKIAECPYQNEGVKMDCENRCNSNSKECWRQYFINKAKEI